MWAEHGFAAAGRWRGLLARLLRQPAGRGGLGLVGLLLAVALLAPVLAADRPVVARLDGHLVWPGLSSAARAWVTVPAWRDALETWEAPGGGRPFAGRYPELEGADWARAEAAGRVSWALWPPLRASATRFDGAAMDRPPGEGHPLGTDDHGRDVLAILLHGAIPALQVALGSQALVALLGVGLGLWAGWSGGWLDLALSRLAEAVAAIPAFLLVVAAMAFLAPGVPAVVLVLGLAGWPLLFRLVRAETMRLRERPWVLAARAAGAPGWRVARRHVLPHVLAPAAVALPVGAARAILAESTLAFLGLGDPSLPSWGALVQQGRLHAAAGGGLPALWGGLAILLAVAGFNLLGEGLRAALAAR